jgi:tetratricopeptide (TPR) repeat protein
MKITLGRWLSGMILLASGQAAAHQPGKDDLGTIHFVVSGDAVRQEQVIRGVKLLHHMMYVEADRVFAATLREDPGCAFAWWGRAMALVHPLWPDQPDAAGLKQGADYVGSGLAVAAITLRERAYLEAMAAYFLGDPGRDHATRLKALDVAWGRVAEQYPDDLDAAAFSALFHLAPARFLPKDKSYRLQLEAAAVIDGILRQIPDHPGALHYKVHAYDFPLLAGRALEVCDLYGSLAPAVPHALHMPSHIYTRRGLWAQSIELNERSAAEALKLAVANGTMNSHYLHAYDYLAYAYLQRGQYERVAELQARALALTGPYEATNWPAMAFAFAAIPARLALESRDWAAAMRLPLRAPVSFPWSDATLYCDSVTRFARALGAVRSGDFAAARRELAELETLHRRLAAAQPGGYWAAQAETQLLAVRGWLAFREGDNAAALAALRRATELEATVDKEAVTPGEVQPAGELLGELLEEMGQPREALAAFAAVLEVSPNRFHSLAGAAQAAEQAGEAARAADYYRQLLAVAAEADPANRDLEHARAFLATRAVPPGG